MQKSVILGKNTWIILCDSEIWKSYSTCHMSTSITRTNMYEYSVSLSIQIYKAFKIAVLCNDQNSKGFTTFKHFTQMCEQNCYKIKKLITWRNYVFMKYNERQLCKTTVAWNYIQMRTIPLLGEWRVYFNMVCALSHVKLYCWLKVARE